MSDYEVFFLGIKFCFYSHVDSLFDRNKPTWIGFGFVITNIFNIFEIDINLVLWHINISKKRD